MGLLLLTLALAYSRGALVALALGLLLWFCAVPLRLRGAALLIVGACGAAAVAAWDFSRHALSAEGVPLAQRAGAGHELGALVMALLVALTLAGIAIGFLTARRAPSPLARRRAGGALLAAVVLVALAFTGALAHSQRGLEGSISHAVDSLTNPNAKPPPNTPGRLTAVASERARYWKEAFQVFEAHPLLGAGAGGYATAHLRYETQTLEVRHAHGFLVQTLADLGAIGLLLALALLLAWMAAAGRPTHPFNRRWTSWRAWRRAGPGAPPGWRVLRERERARYTPERIGMLSMLCLVVVFGAHSLIDWTWYVPGDACVALLCAGWLAGRGELVPATAADVSSAAPPAGPPAATATHASAAGPHRRRGGGARPGNVRLALAAATIVAALLAAWSQWQPQRSDEAIQRADALLQAHDPSAASAAASSAVARDPLSVEALFTLASAQQVSGRGALARATLERAVRLQPSNPQTWLTLGRYDLPGNPSAAVKELQAAIYLDPESISPEAIADGRLEAIATQNDYIQALRATELQESARRESTQRTATRRAGAPGASAQGRSGRAAALLRSASGSRARAGAGGGLAGLLRLLRGSHRSRTRPSTR